MSYRTIGRKMIITCDKNNCIYNKCNECIAKKINISVNYNHCGLPICKSFYVTKIYKE